MEQKTKAMVVWLILNGRPEKAVEMLAEHYGIIAPRIKIGLPKGRKKQVLGCYKSRDKTIFVLNSDALKEPFIILHEFYHHLRTAADAKHRGTEKYANEFAKEFIQAYKVIITKIAGTIGRKIHYFTEVTSTNDVAKELAESKAEEGTIVIAETQTCGRGRLGKAWLSPKGGIWFSVILRPKVKAKDIFKITFLTAVAVAKAIRKMFTLNAEIEWPNDVLINGKKVCGILTETSIRGETLDSVIVGVGINADIGINFFPKDLRKTVTTLATEIKREVDQERFLHVLFEELEVYYKMFKEDKFNSILEEWKQLNRLFGANVEVISFNERIMGQAVNVDQNGALVIRLADGTTRKVFSGDVTLLQEKDKA